MLAVCILFSTICVCLWAFATSDGISPHDKKFDKALQKKLAAIEETGQEQIVRVIGECGIPVTDKMRRIITRRGIEIITVIDSVFIAKGTVEQIKMLGRMSLVMELRLSVKSALSIK